MPRYTPSLLSITAHARSGALDHAWRLFREGGYDRRDDDPAALTVRGRLLKDQALKASGLERKRLFLSAAAAYGRASQLSDSAYPLINAATLSLLAGDADSARARAGELLERVASGEAEPDTPYWREATRAEALLVLGDAAQAEAALSEAVARAPRAWEDHASTLRQFGLILAELGEPAAWLDRFRPPRTLHFAGHMGVSPEDHALPQSLRETLAAENVGFGFGGIAAGADIVIAEALLERGAELHLVLPAAIDRFRAVSVERFGKAWTARFDRLLQAAESVRAILHSPGPDHPLAVALASEVAMGDAVIKAGALMTEPVQLVVLDDSEPMRGTARASAWSAEHWARSGRRRHVLTASRGGDATPAESPAPPAPGFRLAALLAIDPCGADEPDGDRFEQVERIFPMLAEALQAHAQAKIAPRWEGEAIVLGFDTPAEAADAALSISAEIGQVGPIRIGGHYGLVRCVQDPLSRLPLPFGAGATVAGQVLTSTPTGAIHVTEHFAAALAASPAAPRQRTEYVGELPMDEESDDLRLFSLQS